MFSIGDVVELVDRTDGADSPSYVIGEDVTQTGVITEINMIISWPIRVKWENNKSFNYRPHNLRIFDTNLENE